MGLTGAAGNLEATTSAKNQRELTMAMDEYDRNARVEEADRLQRGIAAINEGKKIELNKESLESERESMDRERRAFEVAMKLLEKEKGVDLDGDGVVGSSEIQQDQKKEEEAKRVVEDQTADEERNARSYMLTTLYGADIGSSARAGEYDKAMQDINKQMDQAKAAYAQYKQKYPSVTFTEYVKKHVDFWNSGGGRFLSGITARGASINNWPVS
jgi:TolA-binding protein